MWKRICSLVLITFLLQVPSCQPQVDLAMEAYKKVLLSESEFINASDGRKDYLLDSYCNFFEYDDHYLTVDEVREIVTFSAADIDGNGMLEIILNFNSIYFQVLQYKDGGVYSHWFVVRAMSGIKKDGSCCWSDGVSYNGCARYIFSGENYERVDLAYYDDRGYPSGECQYFVGGIQVTEAEYDAFEAAYDEKEDVVWYELNEDNIASYVVVK